MHFNAPWQAIRSSGSPAGRDNFWTWRERMYALAGKISADRLVAIARQALHGNASGRPIPRSWNFTTCTAIRTKRILTTPCFRQLPPAATDSGIGLTYVPVHYERAGFDNAEPNRQQSGFAMRIDEFVEHHAQLSRAADGIGLGIGAHSLRAVTPESLQQIAAIANDAAIPMHLHVAEQQREVEECLASYGARPVQWLLENFSVGRHWNLVHATHIDDQEIEGIANSGAVVVLCPSTEANLGDGLFPLHRYLSGGGRIAIGSDSHISINPFEELRWLEYGQRLVSQSRNIAAVEKSHVGSELFERAVKGGAAAKRPGSHGHRGRCVGGLTCFG